MAKKPKQERGQLTDRIKSKAIELLGMEITLRQLRLIPYLMYVLYIELFIDKRKVNDQEWTIIDGWMEKGLIIQCFPKLRVTKAFYDAMSEILYLGYVDLNPEK